MQTKRPVPFSCDTFGYSTLIVLFTDFGLAGPYTGQVLVRLYLEAPEAQIVSLFADAPSHQPQPSAYLLDAYRKAFPDGSVFLCVVDPGVGGTRAPVAIDVGGQWFVGPDNGLFEMVLRRADKPVRAWKITWRPENLSSTFHGRDLFAPVAAKIAGGKLPPGEEVPPQTLRYSEWPDDLAEIVYIDHYGNAMTGIRARQLNPQIDMKIGNDHLKHADRFSHVSSGEAFWYENANGLVEIAVNGESAAKRFNLFVGASVGLNV